MPSERKLSNQELYFKPLIKGTESLED
jgi:hypothetical protein